MGVRETFKENLKYYRQKMHLTQEQLSEKIGYDGGYISEIESRHIFPKPETIDTIANALNIRPSMLFDERGSPENIKKTFSHIYGTKLEKELKKRIGREIENVCKML